MIKIGNKIVFQMVTLFIPNDETAEIELRPDGDDDILHVKIKFENDEISNDTKDKRISSFHINGEGNTGVFIFKNWDSAFGSSITKPIFFARTDRGERISCLGNAVKLGESHKVELQFMRGGENDE